MWATFADCIPVPLYRRALRYAGKHLLLSIGLPTDGAGEIRGRELHAVGG